MTTPTATMTSPAAMADETSDYLVVMRAGSARTYPLPSQGVLRVGRGSDATVRLEDDTSISKVHVEIEARRGEYRLIDRSKNGTHLGGQRVPKDKPISWTIGEALVVGAARLFIVPKQALDPSEPEREGEAAAVRSASMTELYKLLPLLANSCESVLLLGENGVGKGTFATAIHAQSRRRDRPFEKLDCGVGLERTLFASKLFGHVKGAFTGATADRKGVFELARGGTVFIDEIADLELELQSALLGILQDRVLQRVGAEKSVPVDFRLISATNRDLAQDKSEGRFREDLYYRIAVIPLTIPPLRNRKEDILALSEHFLRRALERERKAGRSFEVVPELDEGARRALLDYSWPGNVRELDNTMRRALMLTARGQIGIRELGLDAPRGPAWESYGGSSQNRQRLLSDSNFLESTLEKFNGNLRELGRAFGFSDADYQALGRARRKLGLNHRPARAGR